MKELIVQNYNHPSIVVWGLSNEINAVEGTPDDLDIQYNHKVLQALVHEMDKTSYSIFKPSNSRIICKWRFIRRKRSRRSLLQIDITEIDGFCSLNSRLRDVIEGAGAEGTSNLMAKAVGAPLPVAMLNMMNNMTVLRIIGLIGGMMGGDISKETLMELNADLT